MSMKEYQKRKKSLSEVINLFKPNDSLSIPLATGQPMALMNALNNRTDWEQLQIFCGLLSFPYPILMNPKVYIKSGYYGPIERHLNEQGANMEYLPDSFRGFEYFALKTPTRTIATTLSLPDEEGYLTFGTHGAAIYNPFVAACRDPNRLAIAEINPNMPVTYGLPEYGDNKIHISEIDCFYEATYTQAELPFFEAGEVDEKIANHVLDLIDQGATLQLGIGPVPDLIASRLAKSSLSDFGVHSEMISDGFLKLHEAGKISNRQKEIFKDKSIFTFAFGSKNLYDFLDERNGKNRRSTLCLPVTIVNDPHLMSQNINFTSINSGLMIDFAGQVSAEAIGLRQYSGVGGQLSFVQGAYQAQNGKTIICIKSSAQVEGKRVSNILPTLPLGSLITTPRHYVQYIVTEYGVADLHGVSDEKRPEKLIAIAHPEFREKLTEEHEKIKKKYYKN